MDDSVGRPFDLIFGDGEGSSLFTDFCVINTEEVLLDLSEIAEFRPKTTLKRESGTVTHFRFIDD